MHDTKVLLQQSREKLVITYVTFLLGSFQDEADAGLVQPRNE